MERVYIFGHSLYFLFYNFLIYGFVGWIYESTYVGVRQRKFVNRGFLSVPILPIYGLGATLITMTFQNGDNAVAVFLGGMFMATVLEYVTSYVMEKLFHTKWWDYSDAKYNFQGRVSLESSLLWGFMSILVTETLKPIVTRMIEAIPSEAGNWIAVILACILAVDLTITVVSTVKLDQKLTKLYELRVGLERYLEKIKWLELRNLLKERSISDLEFAWKDYLAKIKLSEKVEYFKEKEEKIAGFLKRYDSNINVIGSIQKRLLKAFPNMKSPNRQPELSELKKRLIPRRRKRAD